MPFDAAPPLGSWPGVLVLVVGLFILQRRAAGRRRDLLERKLPERRRTPER